MGRVDYSEHIRSDAWRELSAQVKRDAGYRCQLCNSSREIVGHHRTYTSLGAPYERQDVIALCRPCHQAFHAWQKALKELPKQSKRKTTSPADLHRKWFARFTNPKKSAARK